MFKACIGFRSRRVDYLDKTHCSLARIPEEVYRNERWLEELILDMNMIQEFPPKFFRLVNLRRLSVSENDLLRLPVAIGNLIKLVELNLSKNSIEELPESLASCRSLAIVDFSMNPLVKPPEVLSSIPSLTQIMLNDVALQRLPMDIGNLENLVILEARENLLKLLPTSIGNLRKLKRLDLGNNEIEELPPHVGQLVELEELWLDINSLTSLPQEITQLANLTILDLTKNRLSTLPTGLDRMTSLKDLLVSENFLESVPSTLGHMPNLYQLKLDMNRLFQLPDCFERLHTLEEVFLYDNLLETLPGSIFRMSNLRLLNVDRNHLVELPKEVASPKLHVLSVRDNELTQLPDDIGNMSQLTVLDVCGNRLGYLPCSVQKLKLEALWLIDNQPQPLMQLHEEENAKGRLVCSLLPQKGPYNLSMENFLADSDAESNGNKDAVNKDEKKDNAKGLSVAFDPATGPPEEAPQGKLVRFPTPARRKGRNRDNSSNKKHKPNLKGDAPSAPSIFKKTKQEDSSGPMTPSTVTVDNKVTTKSEQENVNELPNKLRKETGVGDLSEVIENMRKSPSLIPNGGSLEASASDVPDILPHVEEPPVSKDVTTAEDVHRPPSSVSFSSDTAENEGKRAQFHRKDTPFNLMSGNTAQKKQQQQEAVATHGNSRPVQDSQARTEAAQNSSTLQTVMVEVELMKEAGRSLGFSIAGGRGSMPAYEDVDDGVFITKIAVGGLAEADGRLRLGDRLLSVNGTDMAGISHVDAVDVLKSITDRCHLVVSREVLIVLPEDITSPPPADKPNTNGDNAASPTPEDQPNKVKTPPPTQSDNISSPPPEGQVNTTSPPLEDQANEIFSSSQEQTNTTTNTLTVSSIVLSKSTEEMRAFGEQMSQAAVAAQEDEIITEQVVEELLENAPPLEDQLGDSVEDQQQVEVKEEDQTADREDDTLVLQEFAEQLRKSKEEESEEITMHVNTTSSEPRDNYVNYDIAQAVIVTSPSNGSLANSETSVGSGDPPTHENSEPLDNTEVVKSKPTATVMEPSVVEPAAKIPVEAKKSEPKVVAPVTEEVVLSQSSGPLGMNIVGGSDRSSFPFGKGLPGVFISKITSGGIAATTGKLKVGDQIIKVNGEDTKGCTHQEVVDMLIKASTSDGNTTLVIQHDPAPAGLMEVKLRKGPNEKLGISIRGGERGSHSNESEDEGISIKGYQGNPYDTEDEGIFISKVSPGGVAAKDGRLKVGQRILEVNGHSLVGASHVTAVRIMKDVQEEIALIVCNGFDPSSEEPFGSTASMHMIQGPPSLHSSTSGAAGRQSEEPPSLPKVLQSPTIDVTATEEKLDEMLKELEDINKSIASPSTSDDDDENDTHISPYNPNLLSPDRKFLSKSLSTPLEEGFADSNLVTTTSLSTGELNMATNEAIKSIHDEMDLLQQQVDKQAEEMLQSTRRRRNSKNSDYQWAEREKKRIEQSTQELKERTRATQEAARKKVEDTEKKVKEEAEKLAQQRKEEHDRRVQEAVKKMAQEQIQQSPVEHKEHLATMITEIFDHGNLQSDFDQFNEISADNDDDAETQGDGSHDNMDDIVKALTDFSVDGGTNTGDDLAENEDIIKALTDFSAISDVDLTVDSDALPTTSADQNNVVTIGYTQSSNTGSPDTEDKSQQKQPSRPPLVPSITVNRKQEAVTNKQDIVNNKQDTVTSKEDIVNNKQDTATSKEDIVNAKQDAINNKQEESQKPPPVVKRPQRGQKNNPERLSFIERLQLHEKAVKEEAEAAKKLPINRSSSATTINTSASSLRALQKKFAASSDNLDDVDQPSLKQLKDTATGKQNDKDHTERQAPVVKATPKVTTSIAISSVKSRAEPVKPAKEPVKTPTESSQNRYVMQVLENMPPPVTCDHDKDNKSGDEDDAELEGLTPAQARVLQAQQRRVWRANKEAELKDALNKAQAAVETAEEQSSNTTTTTITVMHQQQNDNC